MGSPTVLSKVKTGEELVNTAGYAIIEELPGDTQAVCKCAPEGTTADAEAAKLFGAGKKFLDDKRPLGTCVCSILRKPPPPLHPIRNLSEKETAKLEETVIRVLVDSLKGTTITGQYNPHGGKQSMEGKEIAVFDVLTASAIKISQEGGVVRIEFDIKRRSLGENSRDVIEAEKAFKSSFPGNMEAAVGSFLKSIGIKHPKVSGGFDGKSYTLTIGG